ncbi:MAG: hypothetical protein NC192_06720, partial [Muribaculaceae bacterium]|nr:hypothetical protein [Muribaculaceae bacterium]
AWVSGISDTDGIAENIKNLNEVDGVEIQNLIFSNYTINGLESDSEGQLIAYLPKENRYKFFTEDLKNYQSPPAEISKGEIFISPSMVSMFDVKIGDEIIFPIARAGKNFSFTVKGFYEDPFMGSSMIGMKGFLICEDDRAEILSVTQNSGIDALARDGAMLHIFQADATLNVSQINQIINDRTELPQYAEFVHSKEAISGFMLILHNAFSGLLIAFAAVLILAVCAVLGHSISSSVEADKVNMGILKTAGFTSRKLRRIQCLQYLAPILCGMVCGLIFSAPASGLVNRAVLTAIGVLIPVQTPFIPCVLLLAAITLPLMGFVSLRTEKIGKITPMTAIRCGGEITEFNVKRAVPVLGNGLHFRLAFRQLSAGKRKYTGAFAVAVLLVFFASLTGRMYSWLGSDGKGMMDAFNPADHDIGVQIFGSLTRDETEEIIRSYTEITDSYLLAMPGVSVNGVDYTANVITEPDRFHILEGRTCKADNEIVLTEFVAANFGVQTGDTVTVKGSIGSGEYVVSGIYSCANDMGDNVGMSREGYLKIGGDDPRIWCSHYFLADASQKAVIAETLENAYGGDVHVHENTWPGLFGIISAMQALMIFMYVCVFVFILIVTVMTGSRILSSEQKDLGIYRAAGFKVNTLRIMFALRFGMTALAGSAAGVLLAALMTDPLVSAVMKLAGISNFMSSPDIGNILLPPAVVTLMFAAFAYLAAGKIKRTDLTVLIAE